MKKSIKFLILALFLLTQTATVFAARPPLMRQGASRNLLKPKTAKPKTAKQKSAEIDKQLKETRNPSSSIPANTPAKAKKTLGEKTQSEKAAEYRKQQGLDVRSARPITKKREDADEAAEAARAKGFNARTSTPVDKSKSKVERMTGTSPTNINKQTQITGQPNAKLNPANPSSSGKTPSMVNSSRTSTPVDKSKPKTERLTGEKNAGSLPPKLDKVTNGPPVKNKSQAEKGAERSAGIDKKLSSTPPPSDINRLPANTNNKAAKTLTGGTAPSTAPKASKLLGTSPK